MPIALDRRLSVASLLLGCYLLAVGLSAGCSDSPTHTSLAGKLTPRYRTLPLKPVPPFLKDSIYERCDISNNEPYPISGFALVANLRRTGDTYSSNAVRDFIRKQMVNHLFGSSLMPEYEQMDPDTVLKDPRFAIVRVDALLPPGARKMQRFDVYVSVMDGNNTSSLSHGVLYRTDLKVDGANTIEPGFRVETWGTAEGPIFVNPAYALVDSPTETQAKLSLKSGVVMNGGVCQMDRPLIMTLRTPELRLSRGIEMRINQAFQSNNVAAAKDEGKMTLMVPDRYKGDWEHFVKVVTHLYLNSSADFAVLKARQLVDEANKPDAPLDDISYCWEGLGPTIKSVILPLMASEKPEVAYAAARAAAFLGDSSAQTALMNMAQNSSNPFQISAVQTLAKLPSSPMINQNLQSLLDSGEAMVRIEAYRALLANGDPSIDSRQIGQKFMLDIIRSDGPPLIYASRTGTPRIAVFGNSPRVDLPVIFTAIENRLSISSQETRALLDVYYRGSELPNPVSTISPPDMDILIARLGGLGPPGEAKLQFNYCDIVSLLQSLCDQKDVSAMSGGQKMPVAFKLEDPPVVEQAIEEAQSIPGRQAAVPDAPQSLGAVVDSPSSIGGRSQ